QTSQISVEGILALPRQLVCQCGEEVPQITHLFRRFLVLGRDADPHLVADESRAKPSRKLLIHSALIQHACPPPQIDSTLYRRKIPRSEDCTKLSRLRKL